MKYYTSTTEFNCGIDLHARQMYVCVVDHQLAHNRIPAKQTRRVRDHWEEQLLSAEDHPLLQLALKNDLAMIRHFDPQILQVEEELQRQTKQFSSREYALLQTAPGIGETLGLTLLYEIGDIERFPTVKDFLSDCRLVKGTVASAGKIKGLRGAKLGNPYLRWTFGEAAVIATSGTTSVARKLTACVSGPRRGPTSEVVLARRKTLDRGAGRPIEVRPLREDFGRAD